MKTKFFKEYEKSISQFDDFVLSDEGKTIFTKEKVLLDIKGILDRKEYEAAGYRYWRL